VKKMLTLAGYKVLAVADPLEALELARSHPGEIHLLLTDVVMPGLSGPALMSRLASRRPEMRVMYMSGYTEDTIVQHGLPNPGMVFLQKPFTPETLARKVRETLDRDLADEQSR
jgi:two-component system, cell cycle sensor histidine kinase and response regulator CckA